MKMLLRLTVAVALAASSPGRAESVASSMVVRSPDGRTVISLALDGQGRPTWSAGRDGETILGPSPVILELEKDSIGTGMQLTGADRRSADETWRPVVGKAAVARDHYNEATVHLVDGQQRRMDLVLRAYDDGVAFRTVLPVQPQTDGSIVRSEETGFYFPRHYSCWGFNVGKFGSSHEGEFDPVDTSRIGDSHLFDLPFLCETGKAAFLITESDLLDYAGLYLRGRGEGRLGLLAKLSPSLDDDRVAVRTRTGEPMRTPWRVIMLADHAGKLAESTLVDNLATPSRIKNTSWIRPGKSAWDWWNGGKAGDLPEGTNTRTAKAFIDFAAANGFEYSLVDDGWYAGSGVAPEFDPRASIFTDAPNFNLKEVADHAKRRGVGLWLWIDWRALDPVMERALSYVASHGVVGIKVDFMDRDDQEMVRWYEKLMESAARHKLMVNLHGAFVPRGLSRTYPNFMTQEGVLGAEYGKWSKRITAGHNVMLAYTRGMLGPMDYTPGGFRNVSPAEFEPRNILPLVQTTRAHGLAMYVVYLSPVAMVSDSPDTYATSPAGLEFVRDIPTSWDETRFVAGQVGEHIAIARRKGERWYLGALNGDSARRVGLPLSFLGGGHWTADLWLDGETPDGVRRESRQVTASDKLDLDLAATGGAVAVLTRSR